MTLLIASLLLSISISNKDNSISVTFRFNTRTISYAKQLYKLLNSYINKIPPIKLPLKFKVNILLTDNILSYNLKALLSINNRKQRVIPHNIKDRKPDFMRLLSEPLEITISSKVISLPHDSLKRDVIRNVVESIFLKIEDLSKLCLVGPIVVYDGLSPILAKINLDGNFIGYSPINLVLIRDFTRNHAIKFLARGYKSAEYTIKGCKSGDDIGSILVILRHLRNSPRFFIGLAYPFYIWLDDSGLRYSDFYMVLGPILPHDLSIGIDIQKNEFLGLRVFGNIISLVFYDTTLVHLPTGGKALLRTYYDTFSLLLGLGVILHIGNLTKLLILGELGPTWSYARDVISSISPSFMGGVELNQHIFGKFNIFLKTSYFYVPKIQTASAEFDIWGLSKLSVKEVSFGAFLFSLGFEITI